MDVNVKFTLRSQRSLSLAANSSEVKHYSQQTKKTSKQKHYKNVGTFFFLTVWMNSGPYSEWDASKKERKKKRKKEKRKKNTEEMFSCYVVIANQ